MPRLLQLSDLHFGPHYLPAVGEATQGMAHAVGADAIVISGDFTNRATREQFEQAKRFVDALPDLPLVITPGNHDVPLYRFFERMLAPHRNYREAFGVELNYGIAVAGCAIVSIDSTSPYRAIVNGRVDEDQLRLCEAQFKELAPGDELRVVVAHHHFAPAPDYEASSVLPGARRALDWFERMGVELVLGGHLHRAYVGNSLDVYAGGRRDRGVVIVQSGTTTSRRGRAREREKNSLNVIDIDDQTLTVTHWMYFDESARFEPISRHVFPRRAHRALPVERG